MGRAIAPLATSPRSQQILVYGTFLWIQKPRTQAFFGTADEPDMAVEILREFSASEFVGKLYTKPVIGNWTIIGESSSLVRWELSERLRRDTGAIEAGREDRAASEVDSDKSRVVLAIECARVDDR